MFLSRQNLMKRERACFHLHACLCKYLAFGWQVRVGAFGAGRCQHFQRGRVFWADGANPEDSLRLLLENDGADIAHGLCPTFGIRVIA